MNSQQNKPKSAEEWAQDIDNLPLMCGNKTDYLFSLETTIKQIQLDAAKAALTRAVKDIERQFKPSFDVDNIKYKLICLRDNLKDVSEL